MRVNANIAFAVATRAGQERSNAQAQDHVQHVSAAVLSVSLGLWDEGVTLRRKLPVEEHTSGATLRLTRFKICTATIGKDQVS